MQADLESWQASPGRVETISTTVTSSETLHVSDVLRGLAAYWVAIIRHRLMFGAPPVWSLAQAIDYAAFCRRLGEPVDPETNERIEEDLDI